MPSGTGRSDEDNIVEVLPNGKAMKLTVRWPGGMVDPDIMHRIWTTKVDQNSKKEGSPRPAGFLPFLRTLRSNTSEHIESTSIIKLPCTVNADCNLD